MRMLNLHILGEVILSSMSMRKLNFTSDKFASVGTATAQLGWLF